MANATVPPLPSTDLGYSVVFQMAGALFLVLALLMVASYLLRRYGHKLGVGGNRRSGLELLGQLPLGPRRGVAVVRFMNRVLVLGVTEQQVNLLTEVNEAKEGPEDEEGFSHVLEDASRRRGDL